MHGAYIICIACIAVPLAVLTGISAYFFKLAICRGGLRRKAAGKRVKTSREAHKKAARRWADSPREAFELTSRDGLKLRGYLQSNKKSAGRLAVLAHGYCADASDMAVYGELYLESGFDVFTPDLRTHGESEGWYIGMGGHERLDFLDWIAFLQERGYGENGIILHGESMGGAAAAMLSGETLPSCVRGIVADCAYDSLRGEFAGLLTKRFHLPAFPILQLASVICRIRAGYYFGEIEPAACIKKCAVPVLFIHGEADKLIPVSMAHNLFNTASPALRSLWTVPDAGHAASIERDPAGYRRTLTEFLDKIFGSDTISATR